MRREARVDALSVNVVDGSCTFDGDTVSPGIALPVTSTPAFEATANWDSSAT